jgi:hypothetical protein
VEMSPWRRLILHPESKTENIEPSPALHGWQVEALLHFAACPRPAIKLESLPFNIFIS